MDATTLLIWISACICSFKTNNKMSAGKITPKPIAIDQVPTVTKDDLEEDDSGGRWGWFGFTPDCLQRLNTGYTWGVVNVLTNIATTFVVMGLLGKNNSEIYACSG